MISLGEFILLSLIVLSAVLATVYLNRKLKEKGYRVNNLLNVLVVLTVSTALCLVGTSVAWILKGVAFALILLYASVEDFTKREADDCLWVMILLLCITNASGLSLWSMLGGGIIAFVPTLAMTILCKNGFGGADTAKENRYSYAEYTREKAEAFLDCVMSIAEYVVVDCSSDPEDNILTETVLEKADIVIRLLSPDLKGISNYLSQTPIFIRMGYMKENCVQLISVTSPEFQYGAADTISYFGKVEQIIPYSQALKEQYVSGNLTEVTKDKKYAAVLEAVRQKVVK